MENYFYFDNRKRLANFLVPVVLGELILVLKNKYQPPNLENTLQESKYDFFNSKRWNGGTHILEAV